MALRPKQQRFVAEYLKDLNATQAAIRAGYSKHTATEQGSRLLTSVNVKEAISKAQERLADKAECTAEQIMRDLEDMRGMAMAAGQMSAAMRAAELRGKQIGMFVDRVAVRDDRLVARMPEPATDAEEWLATRTTH